MAATAAISMTTIGSNIRSTNADASVATATLENDGLPRRQLLSYSKIQTYQPETLVTDSVRMYVYSGGCLAACR